MKRILKELNNLSNGLETLAVVTNDGLLKASIIGDEINPHRFGAICSSLLSLSKQAALESKRGRFKLLLIEGDEGVMLVVQVGKKGVLALTSKIGTNLGKLFIDARVAAKNLEPYI